MFWHNFKYTLKILLRDPALIFWTLAFPLIMATLFNLAFSNIEHEEQLSLIDVAVIDNQEWQRSPAFRPAFAELSQDGSEQQLFRTRYVDQSTANQLLAQQEVVGVLSIRDGQPELVVSENNTDATILQSVSEEIATKSQVIQKIAQTNPAELAKLADLPAPRLEDRSNPHLSYTMIEYYTLIAMACLYGGIVGMVAVNYLLANMSASGRRIAVSPAPKGLLIASSLLASYLIQLFGLSLLFAYTAGVLHVDYGERVGLVVLLSLLGALAGLVLGMALAALLRTKENAKIGIILAVTMTGCFLAGMMGITMKYLVDTNLPLLNQLNPANLITDGLYALYSYSTLDRFWGDVAVLAIITLVMIVLSVRSLRKEQYDNL